MVLELFPNEILEVISPIVLSMLPIAELRGGIPLAMALGWHPAAAIIVNFLANILIIFPVWFFLDYIHVHLLKVKIYKKFSNKILGRMRHKAAHLKKRMEVYEWIALTLFVAVPLPVTGAYTGSIVAWILGLDRKKSFIFITLGVFIAAVIITLATLGVINFFNI
ncbi:COG2426 family protein [Nanoarchaeota archaeon]